MDNRQQTIKRSRLGNILVKRAYIDRSQLISALSYQARRKIKLGTALIELKLISRKQLNFALRRQSWLRTIAATIALACTPFTAVFASEKPKTVKLIKANPILNTSANLNNLKNPYSNNLFVSSINLDHQSKEFYYTGKHDIGFTQAISDSSGFQVSLFSEQATGYGSQTSYKFAPQISLFKSSSSSRAPKFSYSSSKISDRGNRYTNSIPVVYMLTVKGRCLLENSVKGTKMWSLDSAKKGVQRKAQLMFSVTKQF
jgi:hypothetical protein